MKELLEDLSNSSENSFVNISTSRRHVFYISGEIGPAQEFINMMHIIRNSGENDEILIHINSVGGDLFTAIQLIRVMSESSATITTSVEGACMSAATLIFLSGHNYMVSDHSIFMFHNYSSGAFGKGGELFDQVTHERMWSKNLLESTYKGFLTDNEIASILENKDIYMDSDEVVERLESRADYFTKLADEQEIKNGESLIKSLNDMIKSKKKELEELKKKSSDNGSDS